MKLSRGLSEIRIARDVVAIEDAACLVSADLHRDCLPHSRAHQISHGASSEVVSKHPDQSGFLAGGQPGFSKVSKLRTLKRFGNRYGNTRLSLRDKVLTRSICALTRGISAGVRYPVRPPRFLVVPG